MPRACFATKADITENNTKADAKTIEQAGWPGHIDSDLRLCQAVKVAGTGLVSKTSWSLTEMENHGQSEALLASTLNVLWHSTEADQLASMVAHDFDQLRQALTRLGLCINIVLPWRISMSTLGTGRFLEISPDFRKASLAVGFEPHEQPMPQPEANRVASEPRLKRLTVEPKRCFSIWRSSQNMLAWMFCTYSIS